MKKIWQKIKRLPFIVPFFRARHPINSTCGICGLPWPSCKPFHTIEMVECNDEHSGSGFFPVCEYCWQHAELGEILIVVRRLHNEWLQQNTEPYKIEDMIENTIHDYQQSNKKYKCND